MSYFFYCWNLLTLFKIPNIVGILIVGILIVGILLILKGVLMDIDNKIVSFLNNNKSISKDDVYNEFEKVEPLVLDYHIRRHRPELLKENGELCEDNNSLSNQNNLMEKVIMIKKFFKQDVIEYVLKNPNIRNDELYNKYPSVPKNTIRTYKNKAKRQLAEHINNMQDKEQNNVNKVKDDALKKIKNLISTDTDENKTEEDDTPTYLDLKALERKARGDDKIPSHSEKTDHHSDKKQFADTSKQLSKHKSVDLKTIEMIIDEKMLYINSRQNHQEKRIDSLYDRNLTISDELLKEIDDIIEKKVGQALEKRINEIAMKLLSNAFSNSLGNSLGNIFKGGK